MRLRNQEVEAIAFELMNEEKRIDRAKIKKLSSSRKIQQQANFYIKSLNQIPQDIRYELFSSNITKSDIIESIIKITRPRLNINLNDLESKVVIIAMECKNISELKEKLKSIKL